MNYELKKGFTLAEVLITLAVIGVVAAITMPVLMTNINERVNSERQANIVYKITQAMEHMRAQGKLTAFDSTESFVDELQKHLKIAKRCDKEHIAECWPTEKVIRSNGNEYEVKTAKTSKQLGFWNRKNVTNNIGLILADGASIILNYDNNFQGLDVGDKISSSPIGLPSGGQSSKVYLQYTTTVTAPIAFVMDVNGKKGPNSETVDNKYHDIRSFNGAGFSGVPTECYNGTCIYYVGISYRCIDCSTRNSSSEDYQNYCGPHPSYYNCDYWAGAKAKCAGMGMSLPTLSQLGAIQADRLQYPSTAHSAAYFWTSEERSNDSIHYAKFLYIHPTQGGNANGNKANQHYILCVDK